MCTLCLPYTASISICKIQLILNMNLNIISLLVSLYLEDLEDLITLGVYVDGINWHYIDNV